MVLNHIRGVQGMLKYTKNIFLSSNSLKGANYPTFPYTLKLLNECTRGADIALEPIKFIVRCLQIGFR